MSSRDNILNKIKAAQPDPTELPSAPQNPIRYDDPVGKFSEMINLNGGVAELANNWQDIRVRLDTTFNEFSNRATTIPFLADWADFSLNVEDPHELELINVAVIEGAFGVAENGAIWVSEKHVSHRVLPFITQYLGIVIRRNEIVNTMHEAMERVNISESGWGCFIAGPSKTADIEQSLVIGAHGARGLSVYLLNDH
ncbi:LutC/YkgG family protein [Telluribacter humicola]|uniref:LutC/YkgG family protein n=1 Tax=Telluribacter humicola TaxID=1720261 RepID=UPI001A967339|nr:LUD domain-containing protein [Telluribacter humicola]